MIYLFISYDGKNHILEYFFISYKSEIHIL